MKIQNIISNLTQLTTRSHSDLQNLTADDHPQYALADALRGAKLIQSGLDASKPAAPTQGSVYFATDTKKLYFDRGFGGQYLLSTNPANNATLTLVINGTTVTVTFVSAIGVAAGNVLIAGTAALTVANLLDLLQNPSVTNANHVALSAPNQALVANFSYSAPSTTLYVYAATSSVTSFSGSISTAGDTFTNNTGTYVSIDAIFFSDGGTQGDIMYYNGSAWVSLPAATSGQFLQTQGAGANPQWATPNTVHIVNVAMVTNATLATIQTTIDLSATVGAAAHLVLIRISPVAITASQEIAFYSSGDQAESQVGGTAQGANLAFIGGLGDRYVACMTGSDGKVKYIARSSADHYNINLVAWA